MTSAVLIAAMAAMTLMLEPGQMAASTTSPWWTHLVAPLMHANLFHLAANAYALHLLKPSRWELALSIPAALAATFANQPSVGLSGLVYAVAACRVASKAATARQTAAFLAASILLNIVPGVAWAVHASAFATAYAATRILFRYRIRCIEIHRALAKAHKSRNRPGVPSFCEYVEGNTPNKFIEIT